MRTIFTLLFLLTTTFIYGQKQADTWYFGEGAGLDFSGGTASTFAGGLIFGYPSGPGEFIYGEGSAIISDSSGQLLFYSNGETVWNKNNAVMTNGDSLMGMYSSTHSAFILPVPLSDSTFYLFTTDGLERNLLGGLRYSVIDMCLSNQLGDVAPGQKNILLLEESTEKLTAVNHPNGIDIWLVAHKHNSADFYSFLLTENGITDTVISTVGSVHTGLGAASAIGQMKTSPDGSRIGLVFSNTVPAVAELFDFDGLTGVLSNPLSLTTIGNEYGLEFSPDNSKLYITSIGGVHQFDLSAGGGSAAAINASKTQLTGWASLPSGMQLGPDDKIYIGKGSRYVSVIENPNALGLACNLVDSALDFGSTSPIITFPSFVHGYQYRNGLIDCDPSSSVGILESGTAAAGTVLHTYVAGDALVVWLESLYSNPPVESLKFNLYDLSGRQIETTSTVFSNTASFERSALPAGLYLVEVVEKSGQRQTRKVMLPR